MSEPFRILTIGHAYVVSLNRSTVREIASEPGYEVTVGAPAVMHDELRSIENEAEPSGSKVHNVPIRAYGTRRIHMFVYDERDLNQLLAEKKFDVLHIWEEPYVAAGFQLAFWAKRNGIPFCFRTAQNIIKRYPPPFRWMEKTVWNWATGWIAGASLVYKAMCEKGISAEKGRVLTLAVNTDRFLPKEKEEREKIKSQLGLSGKLIVYLGRLTEAKGCEVIMSACENLQGDWSLLLMGSGPYEEKIYAWAKERGVGERVKVKLFAHDEVPDVLPAADMLIAPSQSRPNWKEQFGRMVVEAFASGVPVIGSDSGEIPFLVGDAGIVVKEDDVPAWTKAIEQMMGDESFAQSCREKGLEKVGRYSAKGVKAGYIQFYRELASGEVKANSGGL